MTILKQMAGWTEEGFFPSAGPQGGTSTWGTAVSVHGVPWLTLLVVASCAALLGAAGGFGTGLSLGRRRGVRGRLRNHFGVRLFPWLFALFAVGLGSSGVDNWGHAGGLAVGL